MPVPAPWDLIILTRSSAYQASNANTNQGTNLVTGTTWLITDVKNCLLQPCYIQQRPEKLQHHCPRPEHLKEEHQQIDNVLPCSDCLASTVTSLSLAMGTSKKYQKPTHNIDPSSSGALIARTCAKRAPNVGNSQTTRAQIPVVLFTSAPRPGPRRPWQSGLSRRSRRGRRPGKALPAELAPEIPTRAGEGAFPFETEFSNKNDTDHG